MKFEVLTLFPDMIINAMNTGITGRAIGDGLISVDTVNIRDFSQNSYQSVDDYTYGGGAGMLMQCEPVYRAWEEACRHLEGMKARVIYLNPQGEVFSQKKAEELSSEEALIFLCGHYEGIDERVIDEIVTDNISIGDYVLTGGELAAAVIMDSISRLIPGVLGNDASASTESFNDGLLEYPQYTRPAEWHGKQVPEILMSGDHKKIGLYRHLMSAERTRERRGDLYAEYLADRGIW